MKTKLIFVGGIHGVGKTTLCQELSKRLNFKYLSASKLIKWRSLKKKVRNIENTQKILIYELKKKLDKTKFNLLEGHFTLFNVYNEIIKIKLDIFEKINPLFLIVIKNSIENIKNNLEIRDSKNYNLNLLENMQELEIEHAHYISKKLKIEILEISNKDFLNKIDLIKEFVDYNESTN